MQSVLDAALLCVFSNPATPLPCLLPPSNPFWFWRRNTLGIIFSSDSFPTELWFCLAYTSSIRGIQDVSCFPYLGVASLSLFPDVSVRWHVKINIWELYWLLSHICLLRLLGRLLFISSPSYLPAPPFIHLSLPPCIPTSLIFLRSPSWLALCSPSMGHTLKLLL